MAPTSVMKKSVPDNGFGLYRDPVRNVQEIFRLSPPLYTGPEKGSESTRKPASYDKHLSDTLLLTKTVFCPTLPAVLGRVANVALEKATLPPSGHGSAWISASGLEKKIQEETDLKALAEVNVVSAYKYNVFNNIVAIASVLQFPSSSWDTQFLEMSISDSVHLSDGPGRGKKTNYANADAILRIDPGRHDPGMPSDSQIREDMKITANYFKRILPFEFKSLSSGSYHTMLGILGHTLKDVFPWQRCCSKYCAYEHGPKLGRKPVTGDPLGFDAVISGVDLFVSDWDGKTREEFEEMTDKENKKHTAHGKDMLQQIWAEMVKCDATYAALHAGNYELLFFRNRQTQTLYISDVIVPHNIDQGTPGGAGYYQIHVGLYISAIQDAINRARQLKDFEGGPTGLPDKWTRPYDLNVGKFNKPAPTTRPPVHDIVYKYMDLCLAPAKKGSGNVSYKSHRPYRRILSPVNAEEKFLFLETSDDTSENELIGTLSTGGHTYQSWPVVIKVANGRKNTQQLMKEYRNHVHLSTPPGQGPVMVQKTYGFFTLKRDEDDESRTVKENAIHAILLLEYVGKPVERLNSLTPNQQSLIQKTLKLIHQKRLIHGALSRRKIFTIDVNPGNRQKHKRSGKVALVWLTDLSQVKRAKAPGERRKERKKLERWVKKDDNAAPSPLHPIEIGPVSFKVEDPRIALDDLTYWMPRDPWLQTARCAIKPEAEDEWLPGTWLVIKFSGREHVTLFQSEWNQRPLEFSEIHCYDTFFNQESQDSALAYSPAHSPSSGLDSTESSQASSGMVVD